MNDTTQADAPIPSTQEMRKALDEYETAHYAAMRDLLDYKNYPRPNLQLATTQALLDELAARYIAQAKAQDEPKAGR